MKKQLLFAATKYLLFGLLLFSISFGIFKQIKTVLKSKSEYSSGQREPGREYRFLKEAFVMESGFSTPIAYYIGRTLVGEERHRGDMFYNIQYEFLPFMLNPYEIGQTFPEEEYVVLDMPGALDVEQICQKYRLEIIVHSGPLALARRTK